MFFLEYLELSFLPNDNPIFLLDQVRQGQGSIIETINDQLKNISQIEHSCH
jgi:hypothetical protein